MRGCYLFLSGFGEVCWLGSRLCCFGSGRGDVSWGFVFRCFGSFVGISGWVVALVGGGQHVYFYGQFGACVVILVCFCLCEIVGRSW